MVSKSLKYLQKTPLQIKKQLTRSHNEDWLLLSAIEKVFLRKRRHIVNFPRPNTPCVILATGGLDSTISTFILLKFFHLELYPLFINWGQKNLTQETKAFRFFINYFSKHFPKLYHQPKFINAHHPAKEIFNSRSNIVTLRNTAFANHAVTYAKYLEETSQLKIRTVFLNTVSHDGLECPDTTLTAIRATNLNICANENDYTWQVVSLAIEKELGFYLDKNDTINLAAKHHLPIDYTWTCYQGGKWQCGQCFTCWARKEAFQKSSIPDKTVYYENTIQSKILHYLNELRLKIIYKLTHL